MSPEKQRIAIAEACGWRDIYPAISDYMGKVPGNDTLLRNIPDYLYDLNAMHEAEKVLSIVNDVDGYSSRDRYSKELLNICGTWKPFEWGNECQADFYKVLHATAPQRAEAFLRTIRKWEE